MDKILENRYRALFNLYGAGGNNVVIQTKKMLTDWMENYPDRLRYDAAYFLLVNFDQMIFRPHAGYVPELEKDYGPPMEEFKGLNEFNILPIVESAMKIILENLPSGLVSAHIVMRVIDKSWDQLQEEWPWA